MVRSSELYLMFRAIVNDVMRERVCTCCCYTLALYARYCTSSRREIKDLEKNMLSVATNLDECSKQEIRLSVTDVLKNAKPPSKRNVSKEEEKTLKNLKKD